MKKFPLVFLLGCVQIYCNAAYADWRFLETNQYGDVYVDPTSIVRSGSYAKMWNARNNVRPMIPGTIPPKPDGEKYWSAKFYYEYDCYNGMLRKLGGVYYSQKDLTGNVVASQMKKPPTGLSKVFGDMDWIEKDKYRDASNPALWSYVCK